MKPSLLRVVFARDSTAGVPMIKKRCLDAAIDARCAFCVDLTWVAGQKNEP
jgi:hypothetical protein